MAFKKKYLTCTIAVLLVIPPGLSGQEGLSYQSTMIVNPAVTGVAGDGIIRLSYLNYYPGNSYNFHSVNLSYDGYSPSLHGGAGFYISDEYLGGIINNLRGGFSYSYYLRAGADLVISGGLAASFNHRGYNFGNAVLPDQINPLLGAVLPSGETLSEKGRTVLDLATGFMFISGKFFGGFSISHLTNPDPSGSGYAAGRMERRLLIHGAGDFSISREKNLRIIPMGKAEIARGFYSAGAGASLESRYLSFSAILLTDDAETLDLQTGFSVNAGKLMLFYNYRFNLISGENLLPFSLLHHTGIAFSLNTVEKRKTVKTINFPKL